MNVQQLIEQLQKHPPDMRIIIQGYEGGFNDLDRVEPKEIIVNANDGHSWWKGKHECPNITLSQTPIGTEQALLLDSY